MWLEPEGVTTRRIDGIAAGANKRAGPRGVPAIRQPQLHLHDLPPCFELRRVNVGR